MCITLLPTKQEQAQFPNLKAFALLIIVLLLTGCQNVPDFSTSPIGGGSRVDNEKMTDSLPVDWVFQQTSSLPSQSHYFTYGLCLASCLEMYERWAQRNSGWKLPFVDFTYLSYIPNYPNIDQNFYSGRYEKDSKYMTKYEIWDDLMPDFNQFSFIPDTIKQLLDIYRGTIQQYKIFIWRHQDLFAKGQTGGNLPGNDGIYCTVENYFKIMEYIRTCIYSYIGPIRQTSEGSNPAIIGVAGPYYDVPSPREGHAVLVTGVNWDFQTQSPMRVAFLDPDDHLVDDPFSGGVTDGWYNTNHQKKDKLFSAALLSERFQKWVVSYATQTTYYPQTDRFHKNAWAIVPKIPVQRDSTVQALPDNLYHLDASIDQAFSDKINTETIGR